MEDTQPTTPTTSSAPRSGGNAIAIPLAIIVGFGMIAGAIYFGGQKAPVAVNTTENTEQEPELEPVAEVSEADHILGNPNAPIVIVEYSDYDCPFCKVFHETMHQVMSTYGANGKVAWVYRHFPIEKLHPSAGYIATAAECVGELGGNDAFWTFSDLVFAEREANQLTDTTRLPEFAVSAGIDEAAFTECLKSERTVPLVEADLNEGARAGVRGTPHSFILVGGQQLPVNGAQPYEYMMQNIDNILTQLEQAEAEGGEQVEAEGGE